MITNDQGILICEHCGEKIRTDLSGDRICPAVYRVAECPDLGLVYAKPEKSKTTRTGKQKSTYLANDDT